MSNRYDLHKQRVYEGEFRLREMLDRANHSRNPAPDVELFGTKVRLPMERKFASIESIQSYVDRVLALPSVQDNFPWAAQAITVRPRKGAGKAHYQGGEIAIPLGQQGGSKWALREIVVLHELAHHLGRDAHGPKFRHAFVNLVSVAMAPEVGFVLQACWHMEGVPDETRKERCA